MSGTVTRARPCHNTRSEIQSVTIHPPVTENIMDLVTYLGFDGDCEAAFRHYEKVLGGKILMMIHYADAPTEVEQEPGAERRIMHARLQVGRHLLMGGDSPAEHFSKPQGFCANVMVEDPGEAERIFRELAVDGTVTMPISETFWARKFGMLTDKFGIPWMVNCEKSMSEPAPAGEPFVISRTFEAPRKTVWKAFTDLKQMKKWWGPKGVEIASAAMDLQPGGKFHYCMLTPDKQQMWGRMVYREISAPDKIVFVNSFSDPEGGLTRHPMAPQWPIEMLSTFRFEDVGKKTRFTVTWMPLNPTTSEQAAFDGGHDSMTQGWTGTLDKLEAFLASNKS
jgi:uncharacterized glyoxalase superfamily protein PhnB/uncharacterized protein YndB with AHSA1/START domain